MVNRIRLLLVFAAALIFLGVLALNPMLAQRPDDAASKNPLIAREADSRLFDVEKARTADEVTVKEAKTDANSQESCDKAKEACRAKLARVVAAQADTECKLYTKVKDEGEVCRVHRGNFNPTENTTYGECIKTREGTHVVECKISKPVKYTCN
ncbi:MAG: hypothetical protein AAB583_01225 [Patescibacteria group bacterium]